MGCPGRIYKHERFDVADERLHRQTAPVRVGRNCSRHGQSVSTGLLLGDSPSLVIFILQGEITVNQFWPLNTSLRLQDSVLAIQTDHSAQFPDIDEQGISAKLLPAHCVPPTRHGEYLSIFSGRTNDVLHIFERSRL